MSVEYAVLGLLSCRPMTGYDLKKVMQDAPFLPWSGNNNQVYKALTGLLDEGYVTNEVRHQSNLPSKKIYTITSEGRAALLRWMSHPLEPAELRKPFLVRLAWAGGLDRARLLSMFDAYEQQVRAEQLIHRNPVADRFAPDATELDVAIWRLIDENVDDGYSAELRWIERAREQLGRIAKDMPPEEEQKVEGGTSSMKFEVIDTGACRYLHYVASDAPVLEQSGVTQLIVDCIENQANLILLDERALPPAFYQLRTGLAGELMQKLAQYRVRAALLISEDDGKIAGRFRELLTELNRGNAFRSFPSVEAAQAWFERQAQEQ